MYKKVFGILGIKKKKKDAEYQFGLLALIGASILGEIAKPILQKFFGRGRRKKGRSRRRRR